MSDLFDLSGQTALVTGGARGIGQAIAVGLAEAGADIILILVNRARSLSRCIRPDFIDIGPPKAIGK